MRQKTRPILLILLVLLLTALACNLPLKRYSDDLVPGGKGGSFQQITPPEIQSKDGKVSVSINEAQLASMISQSLQHQTEYQIQDITSYLRDGQITLIGNLLQYDLAIPLTVSLELSPNQQGNLESRIVAAELASLPLSQEILDLFSNQLNQVLDVEVRRATGNMFIDDVQIANGMLVLSGRLQ